MEHSKFKKAGHPHMGQVLGLSPNMDSLVIKYLVVKKIKTTHSLAPPPSLLRETLLLSLFMSLLLLSHKTPPFWSFSSLFFYLPNKSFLILNSSHFLSLLFLFLSPTTLSLCNRNLVDYSSVPSLFLCISVNKISLSLI